VDLIMPSTWWRLPDWEMRYAPDKPRPPTSDQDLDDLAHRLKQQPAEGLDVPLDVPVVLVLNAETQEPVTFEVGTVLPEVLALDLNDLDEVLRFVRRFGPLGIDEIAMPEWEFIGPEDTIREWVHNARALPRDEIAMEIVPRSFMSHRTSVAGFQRAAGALKAGNVIARELIDPAGFSNHRLSEEWPDHTWWGAPPPNESAAKERLKWMVDLGLAFFSLSIEIADPAAPLFAAEPQHCLYARCCVELVESMNAGHPYRQCRRCGRYFSRRPDAIYCSDRCKNQAQQERYRKRHAKKRAMKGAK
jgi:predicted nucleic acid-binding Zn ribbon protein